MVEDLDDSDLDAMKDVGQEEGNGDDPRGRQPERKPQPKPYNSGQLVCIVMEIPLTNKTV
jgi:hypothetical protein